MEKINKLVIASHNTGKIKEIDALLSPLGVTVVSAVDLDLPEPEETETTFAGNARLKAEAAAQAAGLPALSDDSGLAVDALGGAPGVFSARWAAIPKSEGGGRDFNMAMWRVHESMRIAGGPSSAHFICVLCLAWPSGEQRTYEGRVDGHLVWPPRGDHGFGYDPIFVANGDTETFAQIPPAEKHAKSHRAKAFEKFLADNFK